MLKPPKGAVELYDHFSLVRLPTEAMQKVTQQCDPRAEPIGINVTENDLCLFPKNFTFFIDPASISRRICR
jgi:hypothetical protein